MSRQWWKNKPAHGAAAAPWLAGEGSAFAPTAPLSLRGAPAGHRGGGLGRAVVLQRMAPCRVDCPTACFKLLYPAGGRNTLWKRVGEEASR